MNLDVMTADGDPPLAQPHRDETGSEYVARRGRLTEPWLQPFRRRYARLYSC
jgi:hypothetical protein